MRIVINCADAIGASVVNTLNSILETAKLVDPEGLSTEQLTFTIELGDQKKRAVNADRKMPTARMRYRAVLPMNDGVIDMAAAQRTIAENLAAMNAGTQIAVVYREIANRTLEGKFPTEMEIRKQFDMAAGSAQRVVGQLKRNKIVVSEEIPKDASASS